MVKQVTDFGRELIAAFVIAGVLRRYDRLGGFLADFLEYLVEAAVEQIAYVGRFGELVLPLLDKFDEGLNGYAQIHHADDAQRDWRLNVFNYGGGLLPVLFPTLLPTLFMDLHRLIGFRRFDVLGATEEARAFAGVTGRPVRIDPHQ